MTRTNTTISVSMAVAAPAGARKGEFAGRAFCPMCTHTVNAQIVATPKAAWVKPGQKCARCGGALDAGVVMPMPHAA